MTKYVRDTKAGKALSVKVILNKRGKHVATVQAHYSDNPNGSVCTVNVWQTSAAYLECQRVMCKGVSFASEGEFERAAYDNFQFQHGRAGGYGYDKFAAALSGLMIDGHVMGDHCSRFGAPKPPRGRKLYPADFKPPAGFRLANYISAENAADRGIDPSEAPGYSDCYRDEGLRFLQERGYTIIDAI